LRTRDDIEDPYNLARFVAAQTGTHATALAEIRRGRKSTHWMWFIFPQIAGLGRSHMAQLYAIASLDEARAYLAHPTLGPFFRECVATLQDLPTTTAIHVFGDIDAIKLWSSLTLFSEASQQPLFDAALTRWFDGKKDRLTLEQIAARSGAER